MTKTKQKKILEAFDAYKKIVSAVNNDLRFWHYFLEWAIPTYQSQIPKPDIVHRSIFCVHDIDQKSSAGYLTADQETFYIRAKDIEYHRRDFFNWIMNLAIIRIYNAVEIFFLQAISIIYFPSLKNNVDNKKAVNKIQNEIKKHLISKGIKFETKNNTHMIQFLASKSNKFKTFNKSKINRDVTETWGDLFELISVMRNLIAHQSMMMNNNNANEIKSKSKIIFPRYFDLRKNNIGYLILRPKVEQFGSFINLIDRFAINSVKFIANEPDLTFLKMKSVLL